MPTNYFKIMLRPAGPRCQKYCAGPGTLKLRLQPGYKFQPITTSVKPIIKPSFLGVGSFQSNVNRVTIPGVGDQLFPGKIKNVTSRTSFIEKIDVNPARDLLTVKYNQRGEHSILLLVPLDPKNPDTITHSQFMTAKHNQELGRPSSMANGGLGDLKDFFLKFFELETF